MKKTTKIVISFVALFLCVCLFSNQVNAAKPVKMNRSKITLRKGKTLQLSLKNGKKKKIKWTTSNKKSFCEQIRKDQSLAAGKSKDCCKIHV